MRNDVIGVASLTNQESEDSFENLDGYPAVFNGVISVGSFGPDGAVMLDYLGSPSTSAWVDVVAPGVQMLIQGSGGNWTDTSIGEGNSFATPIVAGNLALAIQKYPEATHDQVIQSLIHNTGSKPHELARDTTFGYGIVDTISLLAADPTQYEDVNPLLDPLETIEGPFFEDVYSTAATASPSPSASEEAATPSPQDPDEDIDGSSPGWLLYALLGGGLILIVVIVVIVAAVKSSTKKTSPQS